MIDREAVRREIASLSRTFASGVELNQSNQEGEATLLCRIRAYINDLYPPPPPSKEAIAKVYPHLFPVTKELTRRRRK